MDNPEKLATMGTPGNRMETKNVLTTHHTYFTFDSKYSVNKS